MQGDDFFEKYRLRARDILDDLAGHGIRQEADEIAGMPGLERHADFAVGLEAADPGAMPGARVDDDEGPARRVEFDAWRRNHLYEAVVDRPIERPAVEHQLHLVIEHVRSGLGEVFTILIAAPAHDIPEQHAALRGIDHVFHGSAKCAERRWKCADRGWVRLARWHCPCSCLLLRRCATRIRLRAGSRATAPADTPSSPTTFLPGHAHERHGRFALEAIRPCATPPL